MEIHACVLNMDGQTDKHGKASKCIFATCYCRGARNFLRSRYPKDKVMASVCAPEVMDSIPHGHRTTYLNCHQYCSIRCQFKGILLYLTFVFISEKVPLLQNQAATQSVNCILYLKILFEESGSLHVDSHSSKYNSKVILVFIQHRFARQLHKTCLTTDLSCNLKINVRSLV